MLNPRKANLTIALAISMLGLSVSSVGSGAEFKEGQVIVKYKNGAMRARSSMNVMYTAAGVQHVQRFHGVMDGIEQLYLNDGVSVNDAIAALSKNPEVEYAQPNYLLHTYKNVVSRAMPGQFVNANVGTMKDNCSFPWLPCNGNNNQKPELKPAPAEVTPAVADPKLDGLYGMTQIGAVDAWKTYRGSKDMIVADIDTGIDYNHEDLAFNVWRNPNPSDKNDIVGYDFIHDDGLPFDDNEHGTHTAGTIGATGGNGIGVSGVNQMVSIMALKFLDGDGSGNTTDAIKAIDYAITHGAKVLSNSWGGHGDDGNNKALYEAIDRAKDKDVLFVAAAGNDTLDNDGDDPAFPAAFNNDNMIAVAATDSADALANFSNWGKKSVHLSAPGVGVISTLPNNEYGSLSGTSMACPHVAGAAAYVWSMHKDWNYKQVKAALLSTVDPVDALKDKTISGGRLNVLKAMAVK